MPERQLCLTDLYLIRLCHQWRSWVETFHEDVSMVAASPLEGPEKFALSS